MSGKQRRTIDPSSHEAQLLRTVYEAFLPDDQADEMLKRWGAGHAPSTGGDFVERCGQATR